MNIKRKLLLIAEISAIVIICLSFFLYISVRSFTLAVDKNRISNQIASTAFSRRIILDEYLIYQLERSKEQWVSVTGALDSLINLNVSKFSTPQEVGYISSVIKDSNDNEKVFPQLVLVNETNIGSTTDSEIIKRDQKTRLTSSLLVKSQEIISSTNNLETISQQEALASQKNIIIILIGFVISLALTVSMVVYFLWESIIGPISKLQYGAKRIASGDFEYTVDINSNDEIGQLGIAFNNMTHKLSSSIVETRKEQAKVEAIINSLGEGLLTTDVYGKILTVNKVFEEMFGFRQDELEGKNLKTIVVTDSSGEEIKNVENVISKAVADKTKTPVSVNLFYKRKDGSCFPSSIIFSPIITKGDVLNGYVGAFRDITKQNAIDRAKTEFVSLASHQLRSPLTGISWIVELFSRKEKLTEQGNDYLNDIRFSVRRMSELIKLLLSATRIEGGVVQVIPEPIDLIAFISSTVKDMQMLFDRKEITFTYVDRPDSLKIISDRNLLGYIVQNLISNAIDYTPVKGTIEITVHKKEEETVLLTFIDNGVGIPRNEQQRIFQKFVRASNAIKSKPDGSGLGLYITKEAVKLLKGSIWFESKENVGTTFSVELPLVSPAHDGTATITI